MPSSTLKGGERLLITTPGCGCFGDPAEASDEETRHAQQGERGQKMRQEIQGMGRQQQVEFQSHLGTAGGCMQAAGPRQGAQRSGLGRLAGRRRCHCQRWGQADGSSEEEGEAAAAGRAAMAAALQWWQPGQLQGD